MLTLPKVIIIWVSADSALNHGFLQCEALNLALCFHFDQQFNPVQAFCLQKVVLPPAPGSCGAAIQGGSSTEVGWHLGTWPGTPAARPQGRGRCLTCKSQLLQFLEAAGISPPPPHGSERRACEQCWAGRCFCCVSVVRAGLLAQSV